MKKTLFYFTAIALLTIGIVSCERDDNYNYNNNGNNNNTTSTSIGGFDQNGASNAVFSVAEGRTVHFSRGNLQYQASTDTWRFAEHQWDYIGDGNNNISSTYTGWIDLFGYGTSGWNSGANAYQPWSTSTTMGDYCTESLTGSYANADWGMYNRISNGGNQTRMWCTLSEYEWSYLLKRRPASTINGVENARYVKAVVNSTNGLVIFPDNFIMPSGVSYPSGINTKSAPFNSNTYNESQWSRMEGAGCIFLPAAGIRNGAEVGGVDTSGVYWSCSSWGAGTYWAGAWSLRNDNIITGMPYIIQGGYSVRLVQYEMWVDLGLPSGLLWARCNLGATTPEEYGDYYAWGETQPKSIYTWASYPYVDYDSETGRYTIHKYDYYTDNKITLEAADDAATAALGSGARIPTAVEWQELLDNTTAEWTTVNDVYGRKFTASNGNSLFLPATGSIWNDSFPGYTGVIGRYWSSSLDCGNPDRAWSMYFDSVYQYVCADSRSAGLPVHAVRSRN